MSRAVLIEEGELFPTAPLLELQQLERQHVATVEGTVSGQHSRN